MVVMEVILAMEDLTVKAMVLIGQTTPILIKILSNPTKVNNLLMIGRLVVEEYFKMMNGLRSILEIGFALVALTNFTTKSYELLKKIVLFLLKTSKKFSNLVQDYFPFKQ